MSSSKTNTKKESNGISKAKKSRNGCLTCKRKRLKCDETKPVCLNCTKRSIECGGYATNFKWKPFIEENKSHHVGSTNKTLKKHLELASYSVTGKSIEEITEESELISKGLNPDSNKMKSRSNSFNSVSSSMSRSNSISFPTNDAIPSSRSDLNSLADAAIEAIGKPNPYLPPQTTSASPTPSETLSLGVDSNLDNDKSMVRRNFTTADLDIKLTPSLTAILNFAFNHDDNMDIPTIETLSPLTLNYEQKPETPIPEFNNNNNKAISKVSEQEQIIHLFTEYTSSIMSIKNGLHENPWRNLILPLTSKYSCIFNSVAALTLFHLAGSQGVVSAPEELRAKGYYYMKKCILELADGLSHNKTELPLDVALITCLSLALSEQWDTHTSSGIAHLKGAKNLLKEHQQLVRKQNIQNVNGPPIDFDFNNETRIFRSKLVLINDFDYETMVHEVVRCDEKKIVIPKVIQLIFNHWIYFEVLAQMTTQSICDDKGIDLVSVITSMSQNKHNHNHHHNEKDHDRSPSDASDSSDNGFHFFETFNSLNYNNELIDPLLGCGQSLFVIMGKVANLITKIKKAKRKEPQKKRNSLTTISQASELKQNLLNWKPAVSASMMDNDSDPCTTWDLPSCISTAEAYRYSTLLYLHQAVPEIPSISAHALAEKIFILLASIPTSSNLLVVHIFPLLVASCEAEIGEEREWCEARWRVLADKMWLGSLDRAVEVIKEVWKRKDALEKSELKSLHQLSGLMSAINGNDSGSPTADVTPTEETTIDSNTHWSKVMIEWGWEVLLG
ncbi:moc3 Transcriptional regulatory protein moc3 [Candida maltosa Xu316]